MEQSGEVDSPHFVGLTDQQIGGLIIWIPGTVFLVMIAVLVLRRTLHQDHTARTASV
ncbi:MAG: hypothetical protein KGJ72_02000 [Gammaproteobacteria bacterium]|nr:hypothetical protein [Gammaproteobacteria bacterium]